jgi:hypothetical protein
MNIRQLARSLRKAHRETRSWLEVSQRFGITKGLAWRIAKQEYQPRSPQIRERLGLGPLPCRSCHRPLPAPRRIKIVEVQLPSDPAPRPLTGPWRLPGGGWGSVEEALRPR